MRNLHWFVISSVLALPLMAAEPEPGVEAAAEAAPAEAAKPDPEQEKQQRIAALLDEADTHFRRRLVKGSAEKAIAAAQKALELDPRSYEALWRISRAAWWVTDGTEDKKTKEKYGKIGWDAAEIGVKLDPSRIEAQFWGAASLGGYAKGVGVMKAVWDGLAGQYEEWVRKAMKINSMYADGGPPRALGRYYFTLPGIAGGDNDKAIEYLLQSKKLAPYSVRTLGWLAEAYLDEGDDDRARAELDACLRADLQNGDFADNKRMQPLCERLRKKLDD